tara:strand:- start:1338 stop:1937 length:600 start_codon:yes stop_codon:yes gene_type:complete
MKVEYFFPTPVYFKDLPNAEKLNKYLEEHIVRWSKEDKGLSKTNVNGWHSTTDMNFKEEYNPLTKELFNMQEEIFAKEHLTKKPACGNMWANINYPGSFNRPHLHPNSLFSGVYWVKTPPKCGNFMVYDPRPGSHTTMPNRKDEQLIGTKLLGSEYWREVHFQPIAGRILMFPAWLWHEVRPNRSNENRISVSFNFLQL